MKNSRGFPRSGCLSPFLTELARERNEEHLFAWDKRSGWACLAEYGRALVTHEGVDPPVALEVQEPRVRIWLRLGQARARRRRLRVVRGRRRRRYVGRAIELPLITLLRLSGYQRLRCVELIVPAEERPIGRRLVVLLRERARERDSEGGGRRGSERRDLVGTC